MSDDDFKRAHNVHRTEHGEFWQPFGLGLRRERAAAFNLDDPVGWVRFSVPYGMKAGVVRVLSEILGEHAFGGRQMDPDAVYVRDDLADLVETMVDVADSQEIPLKMAYNWLSGGPKV